MDARFHKESVLMFYGNVRPPVPGGHPYLLREVVNTINGSPFVASGDDQRASYARERVRHNLDEKRFPFTGELRAGELS